MVLKESDSALSEGDPAPDFELPGVDGESVGLESFAGSEALLIVFTCNHCPYAQAKFDLLNEISDEYEDVSVVGINPNDAEEYPEDSFEKMKEFVDEGKVRYDAYLRDESQDVARAYGAVCTPDPFLFERRATRGAADGPASSDSPRDDGGEGEARRASGNASGDEPRAAFRLVYHGRLDDALNPEDEPTRFHVREAIDSVLAGESVDLEWKPSQGCSIKWTDD